MRLRRLTRSTASQAHDKRQAYGSIVVTCLLVEATPAAVHVFAIHAAVTIKAVGNLATLFRAAKTAEAGGVNRLHIVPTTTQTVSSGAAALH